MGRRKSCGDSSLSRPAQHDVAFGSHRLAFRRSLHAPVDLRPSLQPRRAPVTASKGFDVGARWGLADACDRPVPLPVLFAGSHLNRHFKIGPRRRGLSCSCQTSCRLVIRSPIPTATRPGHLQGQKAHPPDRVYKYNLLNPRSQPSLTPQSFAAPSSPILTSILPVFLPSNRPTRALTHSSRPWMCVSRTLSLPARMCSAISSVRARSQRGFPGGGRDIRTCCNVIAVGIVEHDKALDLGALRNEVEVTLEPARRRCVVRRNRSTQGNPRVLVQAAEDHVEDLAPNVFENDVDVTHGAEVLLERRALVVEHRFDAEVLPQERALGRAAGDGNDPAAVNLGELTGLWVGRRARERVRGQVSGGGARKRMKRDARGSRQRPPRR